MLINRYADFEQKTGAIEHALESQEFAVNQTDGTDKSVLFRISLIREG